MCRRQFGSTRACYTPIKEREGVLPQGSLVHLPWPQKGLTFTPWCWHDLQTRSLCCLGGYWNCLEETCSEPNRQTGRSHICISEMTCYILESKKICHLLEKRKKRGLLLHVWKQQVKYVSIKPLRVSWKISQIVKRVIEFYSYLSKKRKLIFFKKIIKWFLCLCRVSDLFVMGSDTEVLWIKAVGISL